ncbi:MAG: hypothetical protein AB7S86_14200 [Hydrogenophaga sp.]|uniref:hypothetical protein n=1 Tax=Hydrogenophaga sp. TaxID=1904254 RepID=UPI003D12F105
MSLAAAPGAPSSAAAWLLRFGLAFALLNTLLTFENRWPGFGVRYMPRLSFELCLLVVALMAWVAWRGPLSRRATHALAGAFTALVAVRYADVTAPAVMGRPVNVYWDGRHAAELLGAASQALPAWQVGAGLAALLLGLLALGWLVRSALAALSHSLAWPPPRRWLLATVGALTLSFAAYVPHGPDTRWFFSLPITPTLAHQGALLARVWWPGPHRANLSESPALAGDLSGLASARGPADVLLVFAESYGASTFDQPRQAQALKASREQLADAIQASGRAVVSARVVAPTFGGSSWLSHAALLSGVDTTDPADHDLLLASQRPTLVSHFARHGYRTVGWMPGLKLPWPEGRFYGFERLVDDAGMGYRGLDFGFWRIPDQAAMALLHAQEFDRQAPARDQRPRFAVFPTTSTHAPFHPLAPFVTDWHRLTGTAAYTPDDVRFALAAPLTVSQTTPRFLESLRYQNTWMADYLRRLAPPSMVMVVVGDHQAPALVSGAGAPWDVPVHVISDDPSLLHRLMALGFVPGLTPAPHPLGPMTQLTRLLLTAFDAPAVHEAPGAEHLAMPPSLPARSTPGS